MPDANHCPATGLPYAVVPTELSAFSSPSLLFIGHVEKVGLTMGGKQRRIIIVTYQKIILAEQDGPIKRMQSSYGVAKLYWKPVRRASKKGVEVSTLQVLLLFPNDKHLLLVFANRSDETAESCGYNFISVISKIRGVQQSLGITKDRCAPKDVEIWNGSEEISSGDSIMEKTSAPYKIVLDGREGGSPLSPGPNHNTQRSNSDDAIPLRSRLSGDRAQSPPTSVRNVSALQKRVSMSMMLHRASVSEQSESSHSSKVAGFADVQSPPRSPEGNARRRPRSVSASTCTSQTPSVTSGGSSATHPARSQSLTEAWGGISISIEHNPIDYDAYEDEELSVNKTIPSLPAGAIGDNITFAIAEAKRERKRKETQKELQRQLQAIEEEDLEEEEEEEAESPSSSQARRDRTINELFCPEPLGGGGKETGLVSGISIPIPDAVVRRVEERGGGGEGERESDAVAKIPIPTLSMPIPEAVVRRGKDSLGDKDGGEEEEIAIKARVPQAISIPAIREVDSSSSTSIPIPYAVIRKAGRAEDVSLCVPHHIPSVTQHNDSEVCLQGGVASGMVQSTPMPIAESKATDATPPIALHNGNSNHSMIPSHASSASNTPDAIEQSVSERGFQTKSSENAKSAEKKERQISPKALVGRIVPPMLVGRRGGGCNDTLRMTTEVEEVFHPPDAITGNDSAALRTTEEVSRRVLCAEHTAVLEMLLHYEERDRMERYTNALLRLADTERFARSVEEGIGLACLSSIISCVHAAIPSDSVVSAEDEARKALYDDYEREVECLGYRETELRRVGRMCRAEVGLVVDQEREGRRALCLLYETDLVFMKQELNFPDIITTVITSEAAERDAISNLYTVTTEHLAFFMIDLNFTAKRGDLIAAETDQRREIAQSALTFYFSLEMRGRFEAEGYAAWVEEEEREERRMLEGCWEEGWAMLGEVWEVGRDALFSISSPLLGSGEAVSGWQLRHLSTSLDRTLEEMFSSERHARSLIAQSYHLSQNNAFLQQTLRNACEETEHSTRSVLLNTEQNAWRTLEPVELTEYETKFVSLRGKKARASLSIESTSGGSNGGNENPLSVTTGRKKGVLLPPPVLESVCGSLGLSPRMPGSGVRERRGGAVYSSMQRPFATFECELHAIGLTTAEVHTLTSALSVRAPAHLSSVTPEELLEHFPPAKTALLLGAFGFTEGRTRSDVCVRI